MKIPETPIESQKLLAQIRAYGNEDLPWHDGRTWGYVYDAGPDVDKVAKAAYMEYLSTNALDFTVYPSALRFENALVAMAAAHTGGDENTAGSFTSGGTESILLAVKTARDYYRFTRPDIKEPEMILPLTGHAAFHKAARYFDVKVVPTQVDTVTFKADSTAVRRAITKNTIMIVGSAPSYAHGVVDPMSELGEIAIDHDLWLHCDACVGGFLIPYFRRLGANIPAFDFSIPGVSSLSMDLHKYGYTPKGASLILYRNHDLRRFQLFACATWPGYTVVNNTIQSSKTTGPVAAAWAVVNYLGDTGYLELARRSYEATQKLAAGIEAIEGLRLMAKPDMCMFSFTSDAASIFHIIDEMRDRNWYIQPQFAFGPSKENIHLSIGASNARWVDDFLADLKICTQKAATMTSGEYGAMAKELLSSPEALANPTAAFDELLTAAGFIDGKMPNRWAPINEILNSLPPDIREFALAEFLNDVFRIGA